jgi:hypothetical protein
LISLRPDYSNLGNSRGISPSLSPSSRQASAMRQKKEMGSEIL